MTRARPKKTKTTTKSCQVHQVLPQKQSQKLALREIMSIEPGTPTFIKWSEVPITFSRKDQWTKFSYPGCYPLILDPVVTGS